MVDKANQTSSTSTITLASSINNESSAIDMQFELIQLKHVKRELEELKKKYNRKNIECEMYKNMVAELQLSEKNWAHRYDLAKIKIAEYAELIEQGLRDFEELKKVTQP